MVLRGNTSALRGRIFQPGKKADGIPAVFLAGMAFGDFSDQAEGSKGVEAGTAEGAGDICGFLLCNGFSGIGVAGSLRAVGVEEENPLAGGKFFSANCCTGL